ncbi:prolyl aminopeptidase [Tateyamaria omphalii]|uniref:Proline iminopeptidase n=1 Tax=Tateyamaria omphalii TaxID=299262 RepID=A0A1P8MTR9_9RHOB|nr:prolyl aminopeptidase [Tateyamaria omphalii]APX11486.1 prolyl aminopeptidase [Tateyamaria omphalii]
MRARRFALEGWMLDVGDGHRLWFEQAGQGVDALVLHGGPGSGCRPGHYDLFDLSRYRVTLLDQRGCGRSTPRASATLDALEANTTAHLIADIEALRARLGVEAWVLCGGSWGTTLAMAYAQAHPDRVRAMVLAGVATTAARDLQWLYGDVGAMFPEAYAAFCAHVPEVSDDAAATPQRIAAYADRLRDTGRAQAAADAWCQWETAIFGGDIRDPASRYADPGFRLGFARIVTHYFAHQAWLGDDELLKNVAAIAHIPCTMIHSRFDPSCPLRGAWALAQAWPAATLRILGGTAHSALDADMSAAIRTATDAVLPER